MSTDFNVSYLIDSYYAVNGAKKYFLTDGIKNLYVLYNPTTKELTVEGNPLYYYQGNNFTGDLETCQVSITKIGQNLGVNLFKGIVE